MPELFDTVDSRPALAAVTNLPVISKSKSEMSSGGGVVSEIRKAVRAFKTRRESEIPAVGEYSIDEVISDRPESQVFRARRITLADSFFVIKKRAVTAASLAQNFSDFPEVHALSLVHSHKNVIEFIGAELLNEYTLHIYLENPSDTYITLHERIHNVNNGISEQDCIRIARGLLEGLAWIHSQGVLHGDFKPSNVLVDVNTLHVKLIDFGSTGIANDIQANLRLISENAVVPHNLPFSRVWGHQQAVFRGMRGTVQYAAPEILRGEDYSYNADCWSLGCVLSEVVSKAPPFGVFDNVLAATFAILASEATPMDAIESTLMNSWSPIFRNFLRTALVRDKCRRPEADVLRRHPWIYLPIVS